jgi:hypothetical protein
MATEEELIQLAHPEYWNERYASGNEVEQEGVQEVLGSFEWFRNFEKLRPFFTKHLPATSSGCHILHLGCGNSVRFSEPM